MKFRIFFTIIKSIVYIFFYLSLYAPPSIGSNTVTQLGAPVKDFCLPHFSDSGYKDWDLMGSEGVYLSADSIAVKDMQLRSFSGQKELQLEVILRSPSAMLHTAQSTAESQDSIHIEGPGYSGTGLMWDWNGKTHTLFLRSQVRVVFKNTLLKTKEPPPESL